MPSQQTRILVVGFFVVACGFLVNATPGLAASREKVLHSFNLKDGYKPFARLIFDASGNLYGTTAGLDVPDIGCSGASCGNVFELTPDTNGKWTEKVLHSFAEDGKDGFFPVGDLIFDASGNLYGTTEEGGTGPCFDRNNEQIGCGTIFELSPGTNGKWTEKILYSFCSESNCEDGLEPAGGLILDVSGKLYGTTLWGGATGNCQGGGCGIVFELSPDKGSKWILRVLHTFKSILDGAYPYAGLTFHGGNLYGTTIVGGAGPCELSTELFGCGTIFELRPSANGKWTEKLLHRFNNRDGAYPYAGLIFDANGNLYGAAFGGGIHSGCGDAGCGNVFELSPRANGKWTEKVLHSFNFKDGYNPFARVIFDASGNLYGTAGAGGAGVGCNPYGCGNVFELTPGTNGKWTKKVLHSFADDGKDGYYPTGIIFDGNGNLYGTTSAGGIYSDCNGYGCGVFYEVTP
jgi:uncharacterized repeat protein (TIGR03803 family)